NTLKHINDKSNTYQLPLTLFPTTNQLPLPIPKTHTLNIPITHNPFPKKFLSIIHQYANHSLYQ
ncbi:hypothetical protein, partial [Staphylococcus epidermidis]|uniref:hypothetical protein n=1 Tax=Staphylococcus epidermidis TaxID=1282 RepID=UPI001C92DD7A